MAKGDYTSGKPRQARKPTDNDRLRWALQRCVDEMKCFTEDAVCDHSVGVCYCSLHAVLDNATKLLAAHDRSDKWIKELDI